MEKHVDHVYDWIWQMGSLPGFIPPFCLEVVLRDGTRHFLHSVPERDQHTQSLVLRIWDFRAFSGQGEIDQLKRHLNQLHDRADLSDGRNIHPKLDWANLRLHLADIHYIVEWNDKLWPIEERPKFGFVS